MELYIKPQPVRISLALSLAILAGTCLTVDAQGDRTACVDYNIPSHLPDKVLSQGSAYWSRGNGYDWNAMTALGVNTAPFADVFDPNEPDGYYQRIINMMGAIFTGSSPEANAERLRSIDIVVGGEQLERIFATRHGSTGTTPLSYRCIDSSGQINVNADTIAFRANNSPYTELVLEEVAQIFALHASVTNYNSSEDWRAITGINNVEQLISAQETTGFRLTNEMLQHGLLKFYVNPDWNGLSLSSYELNINGTVYSDPLAANAALTDLFNNLVSETGLSLTPEQMLLNLVDPTGNLWINQVLNHYYGISIYDLVGGGRANKELVVNPVTYENAMQMRLPTATATNTLMPSATSTQTATPTETPTHTASPTMVITIPAQATSTQMPPTSTVDLTPTIELLLTTATTEVTRGATATPTETTSVVPTIEVQQPVIVTNEDLKDLADRTALALAIICISGLLIGGASLAGGILTTRRGNNRPGNLKPSKQNIIKPLKPTSRGVKRIPPRR